MSYLQKSEKWPYCFNLISRLKSTLQMCCNPTVCFNIRMIQFKLCCKSMTSQPLPNFKREFSQKEEVGSYDNIALNQPYVVPMLRMAVAFADTLHCLYVHYTVLFSQNYICCHNVRFLLSVWFYAFLYCSFTISLYGVIGSRVQKPKWCLSISH